jgi:hypothetical protein
MAGVNAHETVLLPDEMKDGQVRQHLPENHGACRV